MNVAPVVTAFLGMLGLMQLTRAVVWVIAAMTEPSGEFFPTLTHHGALFGLGIVGVLMMRYSHSISRRIIHPIGDESGHGPRAVMFFAGISLIGFYLAIEGTSTLAGSTQYFDLRVASFTRALAEPSLELAAGILLIALQPILAHALAPGRED